jgi:Leucine-rich repeat (LRR) protein
MENHPSRNQKRNSKICTKVFIIFQIFNISQFAFRGLRSLDTLDISDNLLPQVPNEALSQLPQLLRMSISGNPIEQVTILYKCSFALWQKSL